MSLNHIVSQEYKEWLDPYVNNLKIDGEWTYKEANKADLDNLILDNSLIAQWQPVNISNSPFGNAISVRIEPQNLNGFAIPIRLRYLAPFSPIYQFVTGDTYIRCSVGVYAVFANVQFTNNLEFPVKISIHKDDNLGNFSIVPGTEISSFGGSVLFPPIDDFIQEFNVCTVGIVNVTTPNTDIFIFGEATSQNPIRVDTNFSTLTIIKLA